MVVKCYCYNSVQKCSKRIALVLCFEINKVVRFEVCLNVMLKTVSMEEKSGEQEMLQCNCDKCLDMLWHYCILYKKVYKNMHSERA